ncbi:hypothetical protein [Sulfitobacter sp. R18_1]|uniref:hypothetical protein n=1 Tax=Sulfitobacter sp. R18_1 TaxID=2821104 RepID=UPI001ADBF2FD|nr:hypothetical protein [Sulfitobacter sp. R18_1]MBO9428109.1 hypothetical protein [Sulfitobacter sp. R18_1]
MAKFHVLYVGWVQNPEAHADFKETLTELASSECYDLSDDDQFWMNFLSEISVPRETGMGYCLCPWQAQEFIGKHREKFDPYLYFHTTDKSPEEFLEKMTTSDNVEMLVENLDLEGVLPACYYRYDATSAYAPDALHNSGSYIRLISESEYFTKYAPKETKEVTETVEAFGQTVTLTANLVDGVLDPASIKVAAPEEYKEEAA